MKKTHTELIFGEAIQLNAVRVFIRLAADDHRHGMLFCEHGDQGGACAREYGAIRVDRMRTEEDGVDLGDYCTEGR